MIDNRDKVLILEDRENGDLFIATRDGDEFIDKEILCTRKQLREIGIEDGTSLEEVSKRLADQLKSDISALHRSIIESNPKYN